MVLGGYIENGPLFFILKSRCLRLLIGFSVQSKGFAVIMFSLIIFFCRSLRKGVPGQETRWQRPRNSIRNEGVEEGFNCAEEKDGRTHHDGTASS